MKSKLLWYVMHMLISVNGLTQLSELWCNSFSVGDINLHSIHTLSLEHTVVVLEEDVPSAYNTLSLVLLDSSGVIVNEVQVGDPFPNDIISIKCIIVTADDIVALTNNGASKSKLYSFGHDLSLNWETWVVDRHGTDIVANDADLDLMGIGVCATRDDSVVVALYTRNGTFRKSQARVSS